LNEFEQAGQDYLALRDRIGTASLATLSCRAATMPEVSYAPLIWLDDDCYLFLSELAAHTGNLRQNPAISLLLVEETGSNPFARKRISLQGSAEAIARNDQLFTRVIAQFRRRFGEVMDLIEPLPDFQLFRVRLERGRFIRGFGQAYDLSGPALESLSHIDPRNN